MELWERQSGETPKAFEAFATYRDLGPNRSIAQAAQALGKSTTLLERWSVHHHWIIRSRAYDQHLDRRVRQALESDHIAMRKRHIEASMLLQEKAVEKLHALTRKELTVHQALRLFEVGTRIEWRSRRELATLLTREPGVDDDVDVNVICTAMDAIAKWVYEQDPELVDSLIASFDRMKTEYASHSKSEE